MPAPAARLLLARAPLALAAAIVVAGGMFAAQATLFLLATRPPAPARAIASPAATRHAPVLTASPAAGTTGTAALPPPPIVVPAATIAPFSLAAASRVDRARALECLTAAVYYEAASEPDAGQRAVAQVVLNRVRHPAFPATVCGVVYQGSERAGCQFSFACDGAVARAPSRAGWARAARNAAAVLGGDTDPAVALATHYHTFAVTPAWNRTLVMTDAIGAHFFHRWKGYWGTPAAFARRYQGGEPLPGPHAPIAVPLPVEPVAPPHPAPAPTQAESGEPLMPPPASQVLDRWKDSGQPLR